MKLRGIYAISDENLLPGESLISAVEQALQAGVSLLQYRNKKADPATRNEQGSKLLALCHNYNVPLIINDDVALCANLGANGVHLGQADGSLQAAREELGPAAIIGITCHESLDLAQAAQEGGASYVAFGRFFASATKPDAPPANKSILSEAKRQLDIPIVAIGGINAENGGSLVDAGADMLAVVGGIFGRSNIEQEVRSLNTLFTP